MSDEMILDQFFEQSNRIDTDRYFTDDQWAWLPDTSGGGNSITQSLYFDTLALRAQLVDWQSAYLSLPIILTTGNSTAFTLNPYTVGSQLAFKTSVLDLINSVIVNTGSGQNLVNDTNVHLINAMKLIIDQSTNWMTTSAPELMYAKSTANSSDPTINTGFMQRIQYLLQQCSLGTGSTTASTLAFQAILPLRYLHDVFCKLGMSINTHFQIQFGLNFTNGAVYNSGAGLINNYAPIMCASTTALPGAFSTAYPTINVGNSLSNGNNVSGLNTPTSRIYYRQFKLSPSEAQRLADVFQASFSKYIQFTVTDWSPFLSSDTIISNGSNTIVNKLVSPSTVRPQRMWVLPFPTQGLKNPLCPAPYITTGALTGTNCSINNIQYFTNSLITNYEHYQLVLQNTPGYNIDSQEGNTINYFDWLGGALPAYTVSALTFVPTVSGATAGTGTAVTTNFEVANGLIGTQGNNNTGTSYRIYIFDISKIKDRLRSPNDSVSIQFTSNQVADSSSGNVWWTTGVVSGQTGATGSGTTGRNPNTGLQGCDYYYLVERENALKISYSTSSVSYSVGINQI